MQSTGSTDSMFAAASDEALIRAFQTNGEQQALVALLKRYSGYVIAFAGPRLKDREAVRDFSQELYLKLSDKLKTAEVRNFKSWLYMVMRNMFLDGTRREGLHRKAVELIGSQEEGYRIEGEIEMRLLMPKIEAALKQLNSDEERCVRAVYLEEKSYQEVMADTGWTFNQVRGFRQRGLQKLRKELKNLWTGK